MQFDMKIYAPVSNPCSEELCLLCSVFLSFVCQEGNFFLWYIQMNQFQYFPPVDFLVHNRLNLFFLPYACGALIYVTGGYKPEYKL